MPERLGVTDEGQIPYNSLASSFAATQRGGSEVSHLRTVRSAHEFMH